MTTLKTLTLFIVFINVSKSGAKRECLFVEYNNFSNCQNRPVANSTTNQTREACEQSLIGREACTYEKVCKKTFRVTQIEYHPISKEMFDFIRGMLLDCCGQCAKPKIVAALEDYSKLNITVIENTDIIFPIFSLSSTQKIYGFWYVPIVDVPNAFYIQKAPTQNDAMDTMLKDFGNLWPLLLICFFFSIGAGFFMWLLDTWINKEEFPREFLIGWFEGFWWSFVSMTTVGYGDKAPKSRLARLFSIGWILIGITIFSMLTASLSSIITNAEKPPSTDMTGKRVGALNDRVYDATVIAKHGGRVRIFSYDNIMHGIDKMIDALFSEDNLIDGFLLDKFLYWFYCIKNSRKLHNTIRSEKTLTEKYSFGALIREENEYAYLSKYVEYNWFYRDTCFQIAFNELNTQLTEDKEIVVFSMGSGLFKPIIIGFSVFIVLIFLIGIITSYLKKKHAEKRITTEVEMD